MKKCKLFFLSALLATGFISCSEDEKVIEPEPEAAVVSVALTDAPGDYQKVFVDVRDVMIRIDTENDSVEGWQSIGDVKTGIYDLLTLTGGNSELLAEAELPPGHLTGMRLVLGGDNTVVVDDSPRVLKTPSAQQSGLKLQVDHNLEAGVEYNYVMDFDVEESIVNTGGEGYILKPVIRLFLEEATGSIAGTVTPADVQTLVRASRDTIMVSAYTNTEGEFELKGLPAGDYLLEAIPDAESGLPTNSLNNVTVEAGETTTLETIDL